MSRSFLVDYFTRKQAAFWCGDFSNSSIVILNDVLVEWSRTNTLNLDTCNTVSSPILNDPIPCDTNSQHDDQNVQFHVNAQEVGVRKRYHETQRLPETVVREGCFLVVWKYDTVESWEVKMTKILIYILIPHQFLGQLYSSTQQKIKFKIQKMINGWGSK